MNNRIRFIASVLLLMSSLILAGGCAAFQNEPPRKQINTVSDWMSQDRVEP